MPPKNTRPIDLRRNTREWKVFNKRIKELNSQNDFSRYLNNKTMSLIKDYNSCPECILKSLEIYTKKKRHHIPNELYDVLIEISEKSTVPIATIINLLIVQPLLIEK